LMAALESGVTAELPHERQNAAILAAGGAEHAADSAALPRYKSDLTDLSLCANLNRTRRFHSLILIRP